MAGTARIAARVVLLALLVIGRAVGQDAETAYQRAVTAYADKDYEKAIEGFRAFVDRYATDSRAAGAAYQIGVCYGALQQNEKAAQAFDHCAKLFPSAPAAENAVYNKGYYFYRAEQWQPAAAAFFDYTKIGTNDALKGSAWYWRGEALYKLTWFEKAAEAYQQLLGMPTAVLQHPDVKGLVPYARYSVGVCQFQLKKYQEAVDALKPLVEGQSDVAVLPDALWYGGESLRQLKQLDPAVAWFQRVVDQHPKSPFAPDALAGIVAIEQQRGHTDAAKTALDRLLRDYPKAETATGTGRFRLAAERAEKGDLEAAERLYTEALEGADGDTEAAGLLGLGEVLYRAEKLDQAAARLKQLLDKHAEYEGAARARLLLGDIDMRQEHFDQAEAIYRDYLDQHPTSPEAPKVRYNLALSLYRQNRTDDAIKLYDEIVAADPKSELSAGVLLELGRLRLAAGNGAAARDAYQTYLDNHPTGPDAARAWFGLGQADEALKDLAGSAKAYRTLADKFATDELAERALYRLSDVHTALGQTEKAAAVAVELRQKFPTGRYGAATLLTTGQQHYAAQRYPQAIDCFQTFIQNFPNDPNLPTAISNLAATFYVATGVENHYQKSAELYARLAREFPNASPDSLYWSGRANQLSGNDRAAADAFDSFVRTQANNPLAPRAQLYLGKALAKLQRYDDAITTLNAAVKATAGNLPVRTEARYELAWALLGAGKTVEGYTAFRDLAAESPDAELAADARFRLGSHAFELKQYVDAVDQYTTWLADYPTHALQPKVIYNLACALEAAGRYPEAVKRFAEAEPLLTDEGVADLKQQAGYRQGYLAVTRLDDPAAALRAFDAFDAAHPASKLAAESTYYRGMALAAQSKWPEAEQAFRKFLDRYTDHVLVTQAKFHLGVSLQNQQRFDDARAVYEPLTERAGLPKELAAEAQLRLGECLYATKAYEEALGAFLRASVSEVKEVLPPALYWAARCYQIKGDEANAKDKLKKVIAGYPETEWATRAKKALEELGG
ncbi:MAG: tetratricopeptide repeat protein [Armatimonadetes bacterium]|nr:tetratricopeptide repeat protein [Armatimonadota bacterium]